MTTKEEKLKKFEEVYKYQISPKIPALEKERIKTGGFTKSSLLINIVAIIFLIFISIAEINIKINDTYYSSKIVSYIVFWIYFLYALIYFICASTKQANFNERYKKELIQPILSIFDFHRNKDGKHNFSTKEIKSLNIFPKNRRH